jgi:hypothetical protein
MSDSLNMSDQVDTQIISDTSNNSLSDESNSKIIVENINSNSNNNNNNNDLNMNEDSSMVIINSGLNRNINTNIKINNTKNMEENCEDITKIDSGNKVIMVSTINSIDNSNQNKPDSSNSKAEQMSLKIQQIVNQEDVKNSKSKSLSYQFKSLNYSILKLVLISN